MNRDVETIDKLIVSIQGVEGFEMRLRQYDVIYRGRVGDFFDDFYDAIILPEKKAIYFSVLCGSYDTDSNGRRVVCDSEEEILGIQIFQDVANEVIGYIIPERITRDAYNKFNSNYKGAIFKLLKNKISAKPIVEPEIYLEFSKLEEELERKHNLGQY
ncbi:hypothetical protein JXM83_02780 [Candidatus Woesearchaeota archaeon]|nr:hypothetical protein [Candidatus Woesearchaeota archaeon]